MAFTIHMPLRHQRNLHNKFWILKLKLKPHDLLFIVICVYFMDTTHYHVVISVCIVQVTELTMDEKLGRMVTRVVLPRVVMHSRYHYGVLLTSLLC